MFQHLFFFAFVKQNIKSTVLVWLYGTCHLVVSGCCVLWTEFSDIPTCTILIYALRSWFSRISLWNLITSTYYKAWCCLRCARSESGISASVYHNSQQCSVTHLICMLCILLGDMLLRSHRLLRISTSTTYLYRCVKKGDFISLMWMWRLMVLLLLTMTLLQLAN